MDDLKIIELFFDRKEYAIAETERKYGCYLSKIAYNILFDTEDSKECVNDTYMKAWNTIPPQKPNILRTFLGKITRRLAIDIFRKKHAEKRGNSEYAISLSELDECIPDKYSAETEFEQKELSKSINLFLASLSKENRDIFVCRYFYSDSIKEIASFFGTSESKIKSSLFRSRKILKDQLLKEGFYL
ncbi:MAG: sigma-70 family RNA polymerase sigma factor [Oscillospiraceae bacterium]|nr:sigma-70 family RNA polymerase sigma factor [Oscillospiraceae bacterium]